MFVLGCDNLIVSTDHQPLLGILRDRDLSSIGNPRLLNLKQRTLPYQFTIQHNPGKWHRGPDAMSRNPTATVSAVTEDKLPSLEAIRENEIEPTDTSEDPHDAYVLAAFSMTENDTSVPISDIEEKSCSDETYKLIAETVSTGFPMTRHATDFEHIGQFEKDYN